MPTDPPPRPTPWPARALARRRWLAAPLLAGVLAGCTAPPTAPAAAPAIPFIDAHAHLNDEAMLLALMQQHGAERAVIFWGRASDNEAIAAAAERQPQRFIAFASISPERLAYRRAWAAADPGPALKALDALLASGRFHGIGEISAVHFPSPGFPEADLDLLGPMMSGIMALAERHHVPVLLHVEWTRLRELAQLLERHRGVTVIWAHGGYTPLFIARRMLEAHPNLVYELSARSWPQHPRSPDYTILRDGRAVWPAWLALIEAQPQRFLIGTDASQRSAASDRMKFESVQSLLRQLSPVARDAVARGNLLRLLAR